MGHTTGVQSTFSATARLLVTFLSLVHSDMNSVSSYIKLDPKPAPLAVFAAEFLSAENPPKKIRLAVLAAKFSSAENPPKKFS